MHVNLQTMSKLPHPFSHTWASLSLSLSLPPLSLSHAHTIIPTLPIEKKNLYELEKHTHRGPWVHVKCWTWSWRSPSQKKNKKQKNNHHQLTRSNIILKKLCDAQELCPPDLQSGMQPLFFLLQKSRFWPSTCILQVISGQVDQYWFHWCTK